MTSTARPPSSFGLTKTLIYLPMANVPAAIKPRLRELSFGPYKGTMHRWTFHDGSTWAALCYSGRLQPRNVMGWACATLQEEPLPVVGVYVDDVWRGCGIGEELAQFLFLMSGDILRDKVFAVSKYWPRWKSLIEERGLVHLEWE